MSSSLSPTHSPSSTLYCGENLGDNDDVISSSKILPLPILELEDQDCSISTLLASELDYVPSSDYLIRLRDRPIDSASRQDAVSWILKVNDYYRFRPVTAFLSVNYFDRFLSSHSLPEWTGWPVQLLSVACLSLAAKMEETRVPLLLDLQVTDSVPRLVFEPKTVRQMELMVMANLDWRMRSITPFDFVAYFVSKLPSPYLVLSRASDLILHTTRVVDFLCFPPSTIAAAAVILAFGHQSAVNLPEGMDKEKVESCHQLMEEYLTDTCPWSPVKLNDSSSPSPVGVLDAAACKSCETQKSDSAEPEPGRVEPPNKRRKTA